jgi:hypothetical protein
MLQTFLANSTISASQATEFAMAGRLPRSSSARSATASGRLLVLLCIVEVHVYSRTTSAIRYCRMAEKHDITTVDAQVMDL